MHGISHDGNGNYMCHDCGATWKGKPRWLLWPARFSLSKKFSIGYHGAETEPDGLERRNFRTILRIGWIRVVLGHGYKSKVEWSVEHQAWILKREGFNTVEKSIDAFLEKITE